MIADGELLGRYVRDGSEDSFSEIVRLRAGFVHAMALRRLGGDSHLANDVTQQVFIALARNARRLSGHPALSGWLYLTTRNVSAQWVRTERRRKEREKESVIMQENPSGDETRADETRFRDNLDSVLDELNERDRQAVLLRFFESRSYVEIATTARITENAARMRVERALEKLCAAFSKRGVTSTAAAIGTGLTAQATVALPEALTSTFAHVALTSASVGTGVLGLTFMSMTKLQTCFAVTLIALGVGGVAYHEHTAANLQRQIDQLARQNEEVVELRKENARLKQTVATGAHPSTVLTPPAPQTETASSASISSGSAGATKRKAASLAAGLDPVEKLDHSNRTTARGAFSTQIWAAAQGDVDLEQASITLRPEARAKLDALLATLPDSVREKYVTPERLMASVLSGSPHPVGGMQILGETSQNENSVTLETQWQHVDDTIVHHSNVELQRNETGNWQLVVPMVLVDRAVVYLKGNFTAEPSSR